MLANSKQKLSKIKEKIEFIIDNIYTATASNTVLITSYDGVIVAKKGIDIENYIIVNSFKNFIPYAENFLNELTLEEDNKIFMIDVEGFGMFFVPITKLFFLVLIIPKNVSPHNVKNYIYSILGDLKSLLLELEKYGKNMIIIHNN